MYANTVVERQEFPQLSGKVIHKIEHITYDTGPEVHIHFMDGTVMLIIEQSQSGHITTEIHPNH